MTKKQKQLRKVQFFEDYSAIILQNFNCKFYKHHLKIDIKGFECDYYPGAGRLNRIVDGKNEWHDMEPDVFLKTIGIDLNDIQEFTGIETLDI